MINPALADLAPLIGRWKMELHNAAFLPEPDSRVTGSAEFDWIEDGAALAMRQSAGTGPPAALWIIGRDESNVDYHVLYADSRGVSRIYQMRFHATHWQMWRTTPEFSQRFEAEIAGDAQTIKGEWTKSVDGGTWEHDFDVEYIRE
jgi:hypothetical protein